MASKKTPSKSRRTSRARTAKPAPKPLPRLQTRPQFAMPGQLDFKNLSKLERR